MHTLDASLAIEALQNTLDRFTYNLGVELSTHEQPTLRDRFAMAALQGLLAAEADGFNYGSDVTKRAPAVAKEAYDLADAMLVARAPKAEPKPEGA